MLIKGKFCDDCKYYKGMAPDSGVCEYTQSATLRMAPASNNCFAEKNENEERKESR